MKRKMPMLATMLMVAAWPAHAEGETAMSPASAEPAATESASAEPGAAGQTPTDRIVARFMALDADESGGVSFDEYMAMVQQRAEARYQAMDANQDGEVTDEEYRAFWKQRMARWYRLKR
jgi:hypothetical protein